MYGGESLSQQRKLAMTIGLGVVTVAAGYYLYTRMQRRGGSLPKSAQQCVKEWKAVGKVTNLHIFPIKSCKGIEVEEAEAMHMGLGLNEEIRDRSFMVINSNNNFLHARIHPEMLLIGVSISNGKVQLSSQDVESVTFPIPDQSAPVQAVRVWGEEVSSALDCGEEAALWLSRFILKKETGARLVYYPDIKKSPRPIKTKSALPWMRNSDGALFSDLTPFHLMSKETVEDLNTRLSTKVSTLNFRPTITISGCKPYEEDEWRFVRIGQDAVFRFVKCCDRCVLTTIDPATGIKSPETEPLRTLKTYRQATDPVLRSAIGESPQLGIDLSLDHPGRIRVGDVVYAGVL